MFIFANVFWVLSGSDGYYARLHIAPDEPRADRLSALL